MKKFIVISGSPGSGKTTAAELLRDELQSPYIDFGWLREFHLDSDWENATQDEENMAFENLVFIINNYIKHGYENIIITDLRDDKVQKIPKLFENEDHIILSLIVSNDEELRKRITERNSGFKNVQEAIEWNNNLQSRPTLPNEHKIDNTHNQPEQLLKAMTNLL